MGHKLKSFLVLLAVASLILGTIGIYPHLDPACSTLGNWERWLESVYLSIQLFAVSFPDFLFYDDYADLHRYEDVAWPLHLARFTAPFVTITTLISLLARHLEEWTKRTRIQIFYKKHVVIYGFNLRARLFVEDLKKRGTKRVVVADASLSETDVTWISKFGYIALRIDGSDAATPRICKAEQARYVFALCDDDARNMKILVRNYSRNLTICKSLTADQKAKQQTICYIHFFDTIYRRLKFGAQFSDETSFFEARIFSVYDKLAKNLARTIYSEIAEHTKSNISIHLSVFGLSRAGQAVVEQLIRLSYFSRSNSIRINLFDECRENWKKLVQKSPIIDGELTAYPMEKREEIEALRQAISFPKVSFKETSFASASFLSGQDFLQNTKESTVRIGIMCLSEATRNLAIADSILQQKKSQFDRMYVRSDDPDSEVRDHVIRNVSTEERLSLFPQLERVCSLDALSGGKEERLAQVIHAEYLKEIETQKKTPIQPTLQHWNDLSEEYKESNRRAAGHLLVKACQLGYPDLDLDNPFNLKRVSRHLREELLRPENSGLVEFLSECEHNRWCAEKLMENWTPGTERDESMKRHPNLVPWTPSHSSDRNAFCKYPTLDEETKQKDRNTILKIPTLLDSLLDLP